MLAMRNGMTLRRLGSKCATLPHPTGEDVLKTEALEAVAARGCFKPEKFCHKMLNADGWIVGRD